MTNCILKVAAVTPYMLLSMAVFAQSFDDLSKKPTYERMLKEDEGIKAAALTRQSKELKAKVEYSTAILVAEELLKHRQFDDSVTALLMDRFYSNLQGKRDGISKPMGKAAALAEAKSWLRHLTVTEATSRLGVLTKGVARGKNQAALSTPASPSNLLIILHIPTPILASGLGSS